MQEMGGKVQLVPYGLHRNPRNLSNSKGFRGFVVRGRDTFGTVSAGKVPKLVRPSRARDALGYPLQGGAETGSWEFHGVSPLLSLCSSTSAGVPITQGRPVVVDLVRCEG